MVKVPRLPPAALTLRDDEIVEYSGPLWRVHRTTGPHVSPWNEPRRFGLVTSMRFDPHPESAQGPRSHPDVGVLYNAIDIETALAESFQRARVIDPISHRPVLTGWVPARPVRLLDLSGRWAMRNGAAHSPVAAPRSVCRGWARAIEGELTELDGLWAPSTMTGAPNVVLWLRAADAIPGAPRFSRPLEHPDVRRLLGPIRASIGYRVI